MPTVAVYSATEAAVDTITRVLAAELGSRNIRVNAINPGGVETEGVHSMGMIGRGAVDARTALARADRPDAGVGPAAVQKMRWQRVAAATVYVTVYVIAR